MSVVGDSLPLIVPFFSVAVILSWSVTCCMVRRAQRTVGALEDRISALESRANKPSVITIPTQQTQQPVYAIPYSTQPVYPPPVPGLYYQPRASAPPAPQPNAMSF